MNTQRAVTARAGRRRKKRIRKNKENWLNHKIIVAIKGMKLVGLKQALKPGLLWIERILWFAVFIACTGVAAYLTLSTFKEYYHNPVTNTFREDEPISKFPFPATTITGTTILNNNPNQEINHLMDEEAVAVGKNLMNFQFKGLNWSSVLIDILLFTIDHLCELVRSLATREELVDPEQESNLSLRDNEAYVKHLNVTLRDSMDDNDLKDTILPFLKNKTLDCKKIVAACWWEGNKQNCTSIFVPTQTDVGTGCTFNRIPDKLLRRRQGIISSLHEHNFTLEEEKDWERFEFDSIVSAEGIDKIHKFTNPKAQHEAGKQTGLSFVLIFDKEEGSVCRVVDSRGFLIGIHSPFEEPRMLQTGITVPPKMEVFIKVKSEAIVAHENIKSLSIVRRKCYFQVENPLKNFRHYTHSNCHQECLGHEILAKCKCLLLTQSVGEDEVLCGPSKVDCVEKTIASIREVGYSQFCRNPTCYSACNEIKYDADVSYLPLLNSEFFNSALQHRLKSNRNFETSIVHISHGSNSVPTRERKLQYTFSVLFGVIGGIWGMILEFSLFTFFNILLGVIALLIRNSFQIEITDNEHETDAQPDERTDSTPTHENRRSRISRTGLRASNAGDTETHGTSVTNLSNVSSTETESIVTISENCQQNEPTRTRRSFVEILSSNQNHSSNFFEASSSQRNPSRWDALMSETIELAAVNNVAAAQENQFTKERVAKKLSSRK